MSKSLPLIVLMAAFTFSGCSQTDAAAPLPVQSSTKKDAASGSGNKTTQEKKTNSEATPSKQTDAKSGSDSKQMMDSKQKGSDSKKMEAKQGSDSKAMSDAKQGSGMKEGMAAKDSSNEGKPDANDGWIVVEEDFWYPFRYSFADAIHNAHVDYRDGREMAARDEINKAVSWLKMAKGMAANKESEADLMTAINDLRDMSMFLKKGELVQASMMDKTFARAANALAKHHKFHASKAMGKEDMKLAARHLNAAAFNIKRAAQSANHEYGSNVVALIDNYGPGYFDETAVLEKTKLEEALDHIAKEVDTIEKKVEKAAK